jgi:hypothetical protein
MLLSGALAVSIFWLGLFPQPLLNTVSSSIRFLEETVHGPKPAIVYAEKNPHAVDPARFPQIQGDRS